MQIKSHPNNLDQTQQGLTAAHPRDEVSHDAAVLSLSLAHYKEFTAVFLSQ